MKDDPLESRAVLLLSKLAADAATEVQGAVVSHAASLGRAGIVARLRRQAHEFGLSAIGDDQIKSLAFLSASDDVAWGRAPLEMWRPFASDASELERAALRARLPQPDKEAVLKGEEVAQAIERRVLARHDTFDAIRALYSALEAAAETQSALWDDPRIEAMPDIRLQMYASVAALRRRLDALGAPKLRPTTPTQLPPPSERAVGGWRRLFAVRR